MSTTLYELALHDKGLTDYKEYIPYFRVDNILRYMLENPGQFDYSKGGRQLSNVAPPFNYFAMEYTVPSTIPDDFQIFKDFIGDSILIVSHAREMEEYDNQVWEIDSGLYYEAPPFIATTRWHISKSNGEFVGVEGFETGYAVKFSGEFAFLLHDIEATEEETHHVMSNFQFPFLMALALLNCKNVETVDHIPSRKRKRRKCSKSKTIAYKTIKIRQTRKRYEASGSHDGSKRAMHIARGHFKTFTDDAPLFGKYTGTYWWSPTIRGNKKYGEVVSDYEFERPKESFDIDVRSPDTYSTAKIS